MYIGLRRDYLFSTKDFVMDTIRVLMEACSTGIPMPTVVGGLLDIPGVQIVVYIHLWRITARRPAFSLNDEFKTKHSTIQISCVETSYGSDDTGSDSCLSSNSLLTDPEIADSDGRGVVVPWMRPP